MNFSTQLLVLILIFTVALPATASQKYRLSDIPEEEDEKKKRKTDQNEKEGLTYEERKILVDDVVDEFYQAGIKAMKEGKFEQAEGYFDRVLILKPRHREARQALDIIMKDLEAKSKAAQEKKVKLDPKVALKKKLIKDLNKHMKVGNWVSANKVSSKILAIDPNNKSVKKKVFIINNNLFKKHQAKGEEREGKGNLDAALASYKMALNYKSDVSVTKKIQLLKSKIVARNNKQSDELYIEALAAGQSGNKKRAIQLCQKALELNPKNHHAKRMLERLKHHSTR